MIESIACLFGWNIDLYEKCLLWLQEDERRRLVCVLEKEVLGIDPRVKIFILESPLQIESMAQKVASYAVFLPLTLHDGGLWGFGAFKNALGAAQEKAALLLSDAADWGSPQLQNAVQNLKRPYRSILDLKGVFANIPALLVGAGPSLEKNKDLISSFREKALIFSGGHALSKIPCPPHFGCAIDRDEPKSPYAYPKAPMCIQARAHPKNVTPQQELFLAPDTHFPFLNFFSDDAPLFDGGWTVGNFMVSLAVFWGCNPIVSIGMDFCYRNGKKYAFGEEGEEALVPAIDCEGKDVFTQKDWIMAVQWMQNFGKKHPEIQFFNTSEGLKFWDLCRLSSIRLEKIPDLQKKIDAAIQRSKKYPPAAFHAWEQSLKQMDDDVFQKLLLPLWKCWEGVFARQCVRDEEIKIHQRIFFEQVVKEHLDVVRG